jgi:hypothetical protein
MAKTKHPTAPDAALTVEQTLRERETTHGAFEDVATYAQLLKDILRNSRGYPHMTDAQREACEAWLCKTARIMAGDVSYADHAHDVAGYATLYVRACDARRVEDRAAQIVEAIEVEMAQGRYEADAVTVTLVGGDNARS